MICILILVPWSLGGKTNNINVSIPITLDARGQRWYLFEIFIQKQISTFYISDDNIRFIKFRLAGLGKGEYRFDNIIFRKLNSSD